jgi:hypothetical protein
MMNQKDVAEYIAEMMQDNAVDSDGAPNGEAVSVPVVDTEDGAFFTFTDADGNEFLITSKWN